MSLFLALISKTKFLGLTLNKIKFSCFTVKCIVVKSMKQYQGMTKEREFFWKVQEKFWKNMQHLEEVCNVTLVSQDNERIRAHKVVLASVSTTSGTCSRLMIKIQYVLWIDPYEISNFKKNYIWLIWSTMGNKRWKKEIVKISWRS